MECLPLVHVFTDNHRYRAWLRVMLYRHDIWFCSILRFYALSSRFPKFSICFSIAISNFFILPYNKITRRLCLLWSVLSLIKKLSVIGYLIDVTHSFLQIINLIMVFVCQDVKLKRMKYHDPILWGNLWEGLYSLLIWSLQFSIFNINLLCLISLKVVLEKSKIRKGKKPEGIC